MLSSAKWTLDVGIYESSAEMDGRAGDALLALLEATYAIQVFCPDSSSHAPPIVHAVQLGLTRGQMMRRAYLRISFVSLYRVFLFYLLVGALHYAFSPHVSINRCSGSAMMTPPMEMSASLPLFDDLSANRC